MGEQMWARDPARFWGWAGVLGSKRTVVMVVEEEVKEQTQIPGLLTRRPARPLRSQPLRAREMSLREGEWGGSGFSANRLRGPKDF